MHTIRTHNPAHRIIGIDRLGINKADKPAHGLNTKDYHDRPMRTGTSLINKGITYRHAVRYDVNEVLHKLNAKVHGLHRNIHKAKVAGREAQVAKLKDLMATTLGTIAKVQDMAKDGRKWIDTRTFNV